MEDERQMSGEEIINPGADENPSGQNPNGQNPENGSNYYGSVAPFNVHSAVSSYGADDCLDNFPPGYRFKPHDDELVVHYLRKKILNLPLPPNRITEVKLYNSNPKALAEAHKSQGDKEWYFFTPRDRKYKNGERPNRAAGGGYWKATGADKPVKHKGVDVGSRKALVFYEGKPPKGDKTDWIMHEFRMDNPPKKKRGIGEEMRLDDWVLCRLYKKVDKSNKGSARPKDTSVPNEAPGNEIPSEFQDREHVQLADFKMSPQENFMPDGLESFDQICGFYNSPNQMCWNPFDNASYLHGSQGSFPGVSQSFYPQLGQNAMASMIPGYHNPSPMIGEPFPPSECHIKNEKFNDYHSDDLFNIPPEANSLDQIVSNFRGAPCSVCPPSFDDASGASKPVMTPPPRDDKKLKRVKKHQ